MKLYKFVSLMLLLAGNAGLFNLSTLCDTSAPPIITTIPTRSCGISVPLPYPAIAPQSIAFSPDGSYLATGNLGISGNLSAISIFNVTGGTLIGETNYDLPPNAKNANSIAFSPNGLYFVAANHDSNTVTVYSASEGTLSNGTSYSVGAPTSIAFSPNAQYLATANGFNTVMIFSLSAEGVLNAGTPYNLPPNSTTPLSIAFSPNGSYLAAANYGSNDVTIFPVSGGTLGTGLSYPLPAGSTDPVALAFSLDSTLLAVANSGSNNVVVFTVSSNGILDNGTPYSLPSILASPRSVLFSPDGSYVAIAIVGSSAGSNGISVFNVSGGMLSQGISYPLPPGSNAPESLAFSPNGFYLATANVNSGDVTLFNTAAWCGTLVPTSNSTTSVNTNTATNLATTLPPTTGATNACGTSYTDPSGSPYIKSVAFSPDGKYLATAIENPAGKVSIFNVSGGVLSGNVSYSLPANSKFTSSVAFSPNGSFLATANTDPSAGSVTIFNVLGGVLSEGTSYDTSNDSSSGIAPNSVAFSPDGSYLATSNGNTSNVTIFNVSREGVLSGTALYSLPARSTVPYSLAFSPNGSYLATANNGSNDVTIFNVSGGVLSGGTSYPLPSGSTSPRSIAFSSNGSYLAIANGPNNVTMFNVLAGGALSNPTSYSIPSDSTIPTSIAFSPDGSSLVVSNTNLNNYTSNVIVFKVLGGILSGGISYNLPPTSLNAVSIAFSPNGSYLATANFNTGDVTLFNAAPWCGTATSAPTTRPATKGCNTACIAGISVTASAVGLGVLGVGGYLLAKHIAKSRNQQLSEPLVPDYQKM